MWNEVITDGLGLYFYFHTTMIRKSEDEDNKRYQEEDRRYQEEQGEREKG
jgi:hypothetical protein